MGVDGMGREQSRKWSCSPLGANQGQGCGIWPRAEWMDPAAVSDPWQCPKATHEITPWIALWGVGGGSSLVLGMPLFAAF